MRGKIKILMVIVLGMWLSGKIFWGMSGGLSATGLDYTNPSPLAIIVWAFLLISSFLLLITSPIRSSQSDSQSDNR